MTYKGLNFTEAARFLKFICCVLNESEEAKQEVDKTYSKLFFSYAVLMRPKKAETAVHGNFRLLHGNGVRLIVSKTLTPVSH